MEQANYGLIGVGVMGQSLALNIESHGFSVALFDRDRERIEAFIQGKAKGRKIVAGSTLEELAGRLERPRRIILLVNAGPPVDAVIETLRPRLDRGDILIDAGNSFFKDTERRAAELSKAGIFLIGSGLSGGEEGALKGPSLMPGGALEAYRQVEPMMTRIAAQVDGEPCCAYMGPGGAGHYVKMVHNGIEYALMQLIGETYDLLKSIAGFTAPDIGAAFQSWAKVPELNSYLFEITAKVLSKRDPVTQRPLVELILDTAEQKGTGKWTSENAFDIGVPIPTINAAVEARILSSLKGERVQASRVLQGPKASPVDHAPEFLQSVRQALQASMIASYAQGFALLQTASRELNYSLKLDRISAIWRGGCIIRAAMLEPIRKAFERPSIPNLMVDGYFAKILNSAQDAWRRVIQAGIQNGIPLLAMGDSLAYYDAYRRERLPANLLQAQRDFFGAHTYRRIDQEGVFHTHWEELSDG